jgi:hypothetical protein
LTAHNWINIKDFFKKPKIELIDTVDCSVKVNKGIFEFISNLDSPWDIKINYLQDVLEDYEFKLVRDDKDFFKKYDYVVPSHISLIGDELNITFDCFKRVTFWRIGFLNWKKK